VQPVRVVRFARLLHRRVRVLGVPSARAAFGGNLKLALVAIHSGAVRMPCCTPIDAVVQQWVAVVTPNLKQARLRAAVLGILAMAAVIAFGLTARRRTRQPTNPSQTVPQAAGAGATGEHRTPGRCGHIGANRALPGVDLRRIRSTSASSSKRIQERHR
jgi:hypothetical protein